MNRTKILEIAIMSERVGQKMEGLQRVFPDLKQVARSEFFIVLGCFLDRDLSSEERQWLDTLAESKDIVRFVHKQEKRRDYK